MIDRQSFIKKRLYKELPEVPKWFIDDYISKSHAPEKILPRVIDNYWWFYNFERSFSEAMNELESLLKQQECNIIPFKRKQND